MTIKMNDSPLPVWEASDFLVNMSNAIMVTQENKLVFANEAAAKLLKAETIDELIGQDLHQFLDPIHIKSEQNESLLEAVWVTCDGSRIDIGVQSTPILFKHKRATYMALTNLTNQKQTARQVKEIQESYKSLIENSLDSIGVVIDDTFVFINPAGVEVLGGKKKEDIIGKHIFTFLHPDFHEICIERMNRIIYDHEIPELMEQVMLTLAGKTIDIEIIGFPTVYKGVPAVQVIFRDITERNLNHQMMIRSEKLSTVGQLASGIAHEIRNPLTSLKGFLQLGLKDVTSLEQFLPIMLSEIERIEMISGELLSLAKEHPQHFSKANLIQLLDEVIVLIEVEALTKKILIEKNYAIQEVFISCVQTQIKQVIINILKNSIESMENGGSIRIDVTYEKEAVTLQVEDEGEGIPEEILAEIFEPFFTTKPSGTGLGLMVTEQIIENHGGSIDIQSQCGEGTIVTISFPFNHVL
ncbi:ATP-binding protein [Bacillus salitolerans]|uniref:histidine kinase n=1 Tax=Bacillus salitolerans TaxID=1437434 RepID=A0ABW4LP29_9BACI